MTHRLLWAAALLAVSAWGCAAEAGEKPETTPAPASKTLENRGAPAMTDTDKKIDKVVKTDEEWRALLEPEQYFVLREKGTERAFTGKYWNTKTPGTYVCAACGLELFESDAKFDSHCGWPSFYAPKEEEVVEEQPDNSYGMRRTEVLCSRCGGHLGHVFNDGPKPTGLRYCINSASIELRERQDKAVDEKKGSDKTE